MQPLCPYDISPCRSYVLERVVVHDNGIRGFSITLPSSKGFVLGLVGEIVFFVAASLVSYLVGRYVFGRIGTYGQVLHPARRRCSQRARRRAICARMSGLRFTGA